MPIGLEPPFQQPFWLVFLGGDKTNDILAQPFGGVIHLDIRDEAVLVLLHYGLNLFDRLGVRDHSLVPSRTFVHVRIRRRRR